MGLAQNAILVILNKLDRRVCFYAILIYDSMNRSIATPGYPMESLMTLKSDSLVIFCLFLLDPQSLTLLQKGTDTRSTLSPSMIRLNVIIRSSWGSCWAIGMS